MGDADGTSEEQAAENIEPNQLPIDRLPVGKTTVGPSVRGFVLCNDDSISSAYLRTATATTPSEQPNGLAHGGLDVERFNVLPILLE